MPRVSFRLLLLPVLLLLAGCLSSTQTRDRGDIRTKLDQATGDTVFIYQSNINLDKPELKWGGGGGGYRIAVNGTVAGLIGDQTMLSFDIPRGRVIISANVFDFNLVNQLQKPIRYAIDNTGQGPYFFRIVTRSDLFGELATLVPVSRADFEKVATRPIRY